MGRKQKLIYALSGFVLGILLTCGIWLCVGGSHSGVVSTPEDEPLGASTVPGGKTDETAAHTNAVLNAVDFINVMAYDGGDGERHSPYQFAVDCGRYWKENRGLPAHKVVLGVPFCARPSWADYGAILANAPDAGGGDHTSYNGMEVYYNGMGTIEEKTLYAKENLGGVMIWELMQDTSNPDKSLLQTIGRVIK